MNYTNLRRQILAAIKYPPKISAAALQEQLINIVNALDTGALFLGTVGLDTHPSAEANGFYLALTAGTYQNFIDDKEEAIAVSQGEIAMLVRDGVYWSKLHVLSAPYINPNNKHWVVDGRDTGIVAEGKDGQDGDSAYQIWLENTGHQSTDPGYSQQDFLNSLKATIGSFKFTDYDATVAADISAIGDAVGDFHHGQSNELSPSADTLDIIVLMPNNDATTGTGAPTATMMFSTDSQDSGGTTQYRFIYVGDLKLDASQFVLQSQIDDTHLTNPAPNSIAKAKEVVENYGKQVKGEMNYLKLILDAENHILFGIKKDGSIEWFKGVPQPIREALMGKVNTEEGKELIASRFVTNEANNGYVWLLLDDEQRILLSVDKYGNVNWSKGVPDAVKDYIEAKLESSEGSANIDFMRPTIKDLGIRMLDIETDSEGNELPVINGQRECLEIADEFKNIRIDWKGNVPGCYGNDKSRQNFYTVNEYHFTRGIPYSAVGDRKVGFNVSIYTFMTAANNPYSLLYTEDSSSNHPVGATDYGPRSAWGRTYTGSKSAGTYYGTVCSDFGQFATGSDYYNGSTIQKKWLLDYTMEFVQSAKPNIRVNDDLQVVADIDDIRVCDLVVYVNKAENAGHCRLITSIKRDANNKVTEIETTEALPNKSSDVQTKTQTRAEFINYISGGGDGYDSESGGTGWLCRNLSIVKAKHNPSPMWIAQQNNVSYQYNNDICTYAGDKCVFKQGDLVVLNYNLSNEAGFDTTWQGIKLYKYTTGYHQSDGVLVPDFSKQLVDTYLFADFDTINSTNYGTLDSSQAGHALVLGNGLENGSYMAVMFNANEESEPTMFEVIEIQKIGVSQKDAVIEVSFEKSINVNEIIRATVLSEDLKTGYAFYNLTYYDNSKSNCSFNVIELNKIQYNGSLRNGQRCRLSLIAKNKYGNKFFYSEPFTIKL